MNRWERRERKLRKRRDAMQQSGAGLKKMLLPLIQKKAESAAKAKRAAPRGDRPLRLPTSTRRSGLGS